LNYAENIGKYFKIFIGFLHVICGAKNLLVIDGEGKRQNYEDNK
jgi:hypothetical protein